jgi:hypothetical protein
MKFIKNIALYLSSRCTDFSSWAALAIFILWFLNLNTFLLIVLIAMFFLDDTVFKGWIDKANAKREELENNLRGRKNEEEIQS